MSFNIKLDILAVGCLSAAAFIAPVNAQAHYKLVKTLDLPGTQGGHGDWTTFDPASKTVWLSQSPDHNVVVIDAATLAIKSVIPDIKNGNGIAHSSRRLIRRNELTTMSRPAPPTSRIGIKGDTPLPRFTERSSRNMP